MCEDMFFCWVQLIFHLYIALIGDNPMHLPKPLQIHEGQAREHNPILGCTKTNIHGRPR